MLETIVGAFGTAAFFYGVAGLIFAVPFALLWSGRIDAAAQRGSWGFRLAILPGAIALWPLIALKTLQARRHPASAPDPERPVSPRTLRLTHGIVFLALGAVVPMICAAALLTRPRVEVTVAGQLQPAPLPNIVPLEIPGPNGLPIKAALRTDGSSYQVELEVSQPLEEPVVALYWNPGTEAHGLADEPNFLGSVWGPSRLLFKLPIEGRLSSGALTLIALTGNRRVLGTLPVRSR